MDFYRELSKLAGKPFWSHKPLFAIQELLAAFHWDRLNDIYAGHESFISEREKEKTVARACNRLKALDDVLKEHGYHHLMYISTNTKQLFENEPADLLVSEYLHKNAIHPVYIRGRSELRSLKREDLKRMFYDWNHLTADGHELRATIISSDLRRILPEMTERKSQDEGSK